MENRRAGGYLCLGWRRGAAALVAAAAACAVGSVAGCGGNPFSPRASDYGDRLPAERLRSIERVSMDAYKAPERPQDADPLAAARARFEGMGEAALTLEECRASALANNLDLRVVLLDPTIASQRVSEEEARFESAFTLRSQWRDLDAPTASSLVGSQQKSQVVVPGVRIPTRSGGSVEVRLPVSRVEDNNEFSLLNPAYSSDLEFSLTQQLLRGAGRRANTALIRIASYNQQATEAQTKLEAIRQLAAVDRAYWRLYQTRRELEVRQQQYDLARAQLDRADRRARSGLAREIEVTRAQAGLAERLEAIIIAQNRVLLQQRELKRIINLEGLDLGSRTVIVPSSPPDPVEYVFTRDELVDKALANRMEMLELEIRLAADAAQIDLARNQALPLVTLDYTYRVNGLGGSMQDTFRTLERNRFEDWELGLNAEIPLDNEAARSAIRRALLERIQRLGSREARAASIRQEVLNAVDTIEAGWQRVLAARQSVILAARTLEAEQRQFEAGGSTSTDVLDAASRLAEAQSAEVQALTDYQVSQVDLAFATGTLLGAGRVDWEPAPEPALDDKDPSEAIGEPEIGLAR